MTFIKDAFRRLVLIRNRLDVCDNFAIFALSVCLKFLVESVKIYMFVQISGTKNVN